MRDGVQIPRVLYTSNEDKQLNVRAFHDLLPQGVSIVANYIDRSIPQISQLCAAIEREMGIYTEVNAYLSFFKGGAFKPHFDVTDVLVVQVHGNKQWRIWNTEMPYPIKLADRAKVNASVPPDQEIEMAPGDVLFIPRGEPHSAAVSTKHSVHLTISLINQTGIDFFSPAQGGRQGSSLAHGPPAAFIGRANMCARSRTQATATPTDRSSQHVAVFAGG